VGEWRIIEGDCRDVLVTLPAASVQCCITSPPYFGLRDYGTAAWDGGDPDCDHMRAYETPRAARETTPGRNAFGGPSDAAKDAGRARYRDLCRKCGAIRIDRQIGLESSLDEYMTAMRGVFAGVWRVLRDDGTLWLNMGDAYANDGKWGGHTGGKHVAALHCSPIGRNKKYTGFKPKDLMGLPWRVAFALQEEGWYLRSDIVWHKPNPMPESVTDRPTRSHEFIFLLTKNSSYFYDGDAIREPYSEASIGRYEYEMQGTAPNALQPGGNVQRRTDEIRRLGPNPLGRNRRDVWSVATHSFKEAHFATFPPDLIVPCVLAGCPAGGTILDPFAGAGTTGLVAARHDRNFIGIELNPAYAAMARERIAGDAPLLQGTEATA
jgi:DNA modification methylase